KQLQRAVRALLEVGDRHRRGWSHPEIRRRAVHAAPYRGGRENHPGGLDQTPRARARDPGLKEAAMDTMLEAGATARGQAGLKPHEVMIISGIGCSSNLPGYVNTYGMHTLHGRALAVATGAQLANHDLKIVVTGGDGDGYGIGGNHFLHSMRRNVDLTYVVMNNQVYGLTTGQLSPTSVKGMNTKSTPFGSVENPIN